MKYDDLPMLVRESTLRSFREGVYDRLGARDMLLRMSSASGHLTRAVMENSRDEMERWSAELLVHLIDMTFICGSDVESCLRKRIVERDAEVQLDYIEDEDV